MEDVENLNTEQVAEKLGKPVDFVRMLCREGFFDEAYKDKGNWVIPSTEIVKFNNSRAKSEILYAKSKKFKRSVETIAALVTILGFLVFGPFDFYERFFDDRDNNLEGTLPDFRIPGSRASSSR